jgi:hypothetical protein
LTWAYTLAPAIRDQMHFHIEAIRHLKEFIEMHLGAFWYDAHMTIQEPYIFEHFLTLSQSKPKKKAKVNNAMQRIAETAGVR